MVSRKDLLVIGIISILLSVTGFILDINERVPDIRINVFDISMMAGLICGIISILYFPIKLLANRFGRQ